MILSKPEIIVWAVVEEEDYRSAGGSKQFDHALSGLADSDPLHWNEKKRCDWQVWQSGEQFGCGLSINVKCLFTNLALAGSPRWTECNSVPVTADPRSSGLPQCCSTSRATSCTPPTPASKRPCLLQQKHINNTEWKMKRLCSGLQLLIHYTTAAQPESTWWNKSGWGKEPVHRTSSTNEKCRREVCVNVQAECSCSVAWGRKREAVWSSFRSLS